MVYDRADRGGIDEDHPTKPASPYAASKLAGEALTLSYHHAYGLPTTVVRPFNTYGPFQRSVGEGGVVAIFTRRSILGEELQVFGDGTQTRDLLYVEDCARFVVAALASDAALGRVLNAGTGADVSINALAVLIEPDASRIVHVPHIHPQSEIRCCAAIPAGSGAAGLSNGRAARGPRAALVDGGAPGRRGTGALMGTGAATRLAIDGGTPVRATFLPYAHQIISEEDVAAVAEALRSDWLTTGPRVPAFESLLAGRPARGMRSRSAGTAALHGATVAAASARATRRSPRR